MDIYLDYRTRRRGASCLILAEMLDTIYLKVKVAELK